MSIIDLGKQSLIYGAGHVLARLITFLLLLSTHIHLHKMSMVHIISVCIYGICVNPLQIWYGYRNDEIFSTKEGLERKNTLP